MIESSEINTLLQHNLRPRRSRLLAFAGGIGLVMAVLMVIMVATEPQPLPTRTVVALLGIAVGGLSWAALATWRLTRHEVLLLHDRVAAYGLGTFWSVVATAGGVSIALSRGEVAAALAVLAVGSTVSASSVLLLNRAIAALRLAQRSLDRLT